MALIPCFSEGGRMLTDVSRPPVYNTFEGRSSDRLDVVLTMFHRFPRGEPSSTSRCEGAAGFRVQGSWF